MWSEIKCLKVSLALMWSQVIVTQQSGLLCAVWHYFGCRPALLALGFSDCLGFIDACAPFTLFPLPFSLLRWLLWPVGRMILIPESDQWLYESLVSVSVSKFHIDSCRFLGFKIVHRPGVHQGKFCFRLIASVFSFGGCFILPLNVASIFGAFEGCLWASRVLAWFSIVFSFFLRIILSFVHELLQLSFVPHLILGFGPFKPYVL